MKKVVQVVPYNPNWPEVFASEAEIIKEVLGDNCMAVHHIGSTSITGLLAKPKIDIIAVVKDPRLACAQFQKAGIQYLGEYNIPMRYFFRKRRNSDLNLHVYEESHPEIELNLMFRDYLRAHPKVRDEYAQLKAELVQDKSSFIKQKDSPFTNYTLRKADFIRKVLKNAGFKQIRMLKCNDETEWKAARYFRNKYFFSPHGIDDPYTWTFDHPEHAHLILYQGADIIGYAHIQFWPNARSAIRIIVVEENKQNQNLGSRFLDLCEKWLKILGVKSIHAESRQTALRFYLKNGYTEMPFNDPEPHESDPHDIPVGKVL